MVCAADNQIFYININGIGYIIKPIAVVEAKDNKHAVGGGIQQAMEYAQILDLKFAYSSNGDAFLEHDFITGKETEIKLEDFPTWTLLPIIIIIRK